jgi:hypothetical protein
MLLKVQQKRTKSRSKKKDYFVHNTAGNKVIYVGIDNCYL